MMCEERINNVVHQWVRIGAMFNTSPYESDVDIERLLLETARCAPAHSRLLVMSVTWLVNYGEFVLKHRLVQLINAELEKEHRPAMGLILDLAREKGDSNSHRFNQAIEACGDARDHHPLALIDRRDDFSIRMAEKNAIPLSKKWGRWIEDFKLKQNAIRPISWILEHNPQLRWRGDFKGDLRASILAELIENPDSGSSESEMSRACGASRAATIEALHKLELSGRITRRRVKNRSTIHLVAG